MSVQNWHEEFDKSWPEYSKISKKFHFNGLSLTKVYNVWDKKNTEELSLKAINIDARFEWKLTCGFKNDIRNWEIFTRALESLKIGTLIGFFYPK